MKRVWLYGWACMAVWVASVRAEPPHLQFVEDLRARGMPDLALDYLNQLAKKPPPGLKSRIPIEIARTRVSLAENLDDERRRDRQIEEARATIEKLLSEKPTEYIRAIALLEIARIASAQSRYRLSSARRIDDRGARQTALANTRVSIDDAIHKLDSAITVFEKTQPLETAKEKSLTVLMLESRFDRASLLLERAKTFSDRQFKNRNIDIEASRKSFERIAKQELNDSIVWRARIMVGRCWLELENATEARKTADELAQATAIPGDAIRGLRFLQLQLLEKDHTNKNRLNDLIRGCDDWLKENVNAVHVSERAGIQSLLAGGLIEQSQMSIRATGNSSASLPETIRANLRRAERLLRPLIDSESEYARRARALRGEVLSILIADRNRFVFAAPLSLDECQLVAQAEAAEMAGPTDEDAGTRKRHLREAIRWLERGISLAGAGDSPRDLLDARLMLAYLYLRDGDPYACAVLGESIARQTGFASRNARGATYAISAYAAILQESRARTAKPEIVEADRNRLRDMAGFMDRTWPDVGETDIARFQLGSMYFDERQYWDAFEMLIAINPGFPLLAEARYRAGVAAQALQQVDLKLPTENKLKALNQAIGQLESLEMPADGSSAESIATAFQAKLQLGTLLLISAKNEADYHRAEQLGTQLLKEIESRVAADDGVLPQLIAEATRLSTAGLTGRAYERLKARQYAQAHELLEPTVTTIVKNATTLLASPNADKPWRRAMISGYRDLLLLDLRANIHAGNAPAVKVGIPQLKLFADARNQESLFGSLLQLVYDLKNDLAEAKKAKSSEVARQIESGMIALVDEVAQTKDPSIELRVFLAQVYSDIGQHEKAAAYLQAATSPNDNDEKGLRAFRFSRIELAKEFRLAKEFNQAKVVLKDALGTPAHRGWGFDNFDIRRESILLMSDEGNTVGAARMATQMQEKLLPLAREFQAKSARIKAARSELAGLRGDATTKTAAEIERLEQELQKLMPSRERYFEFYCLELQAVVAHALRLPTEKANESLARVAARLAKMEQSNPDLGGEANQSRFRELLALHPEIATRYVAAGGIILRDQSK